MKIQELTEGMKVVYTSKGGETKEIGIIERISHSGTVFVKYFNKAGQLEYHSKATNVEDLEKSEEQLELFSKK